MQSCLTPLPTTKSAERVPLCSTRHLEPLCVELMVDTNLLGMVFPLFSVQSRGLLYPCCQRPTKTRCKSERWVNMVNTSRSSSAACLITIYDGIKMVFYPVQYDLEDEFGACGQDTDSPPIITILKSVHSFA